MLTTIKVSTETRDRLKRGARAQGSTLERYLLHLLAESERRDRLAALRRAVVETPADALAAHAAEAAEWEGAEWERAE